MHMYTQNPYLPRLRMEAVKKTVKESWSLRQTARYYGVQASTILRWKHRTEQLPGRALCIPTRSSRPHHHPHEIPRDLIHRVIDYRMKYQRCAKVLHYLLQRDGITVSLSSVERILRRYNLVRHSKWKKWHTYPVRPLPEKPGVLAEIDTIWDGETPRDRLFVYSLVDLCSRWAHANVCEKATCYSSIRFIRETNKCVPFLIQTLQSDHGSEFSRYFTQRMNLLGIAHRHSRIRKPTDNGHVERFNRTLQEECLARIPRSKHLYAKEIREYLHYYNYERPHMGLDMKTPMDIIHELT